MHAATFTVTSNADTGGSTCGATCTLRQAIGAANANTKDADIITFASNVRGDIDLTTSDDGGNGRGASALALLGPTDIQGPGANVLNVRGVGSTFRLLRVTSGVNATLSGLTFSGANSPNSGGAIYNDAGSLTLVGCAISGNTAGSFGGGIYSGNAGLTLRNCTVSGNTSNRSGGGSGSGGGIASSGSANGSSLTLSNSTISGNSVPNGNGGGNGGGILADTYLSISNCTIAGNSAAGGGSASGVISGGNLSINNSIVAANINNNAQPDIVREAGSVTSGGYNLIGNPGNVTFNGAGDQKGTAATPLNPQIGALALNSPGTTQTHALRPGSPAIDAGNSALTSDQRGSGRPVDIASVANVGNGSDIGAYELDTAQSGADLVVNQTDDHDDGTCGAGDCTLREAINAASGNGAAQNNITFDATVFASKQAIKLSQGLLPLINTDILITGPTASGAGVTVDAGGNSRIFGVIGGTSTFSNLTLSGGNINGDDGGAIKQGGASVLTLNNCTISGNMATVSGGAIATNAMLTLNSCTLSGNTAIFGGGILSSGTLTLNSCTLSDNSTSGNGGANMGGGILSEGTLTLNSCTLSGNRAGNGGGVFINSGTFNSSNTIVAGNTAPTNPDLSGTITAGDYNLIGNKQGAFFPGSASHNITDVDAKLGPLADNKGPTFTRALLPGSPAIDAGNTPFTTDQRGRVRPFDFAGVANAANGNGSDIGAFELNETPQSGANFVVNQITDTDDGVCGPTDCTLREAMNAAEGNADASTITFDATVFATRQTIALGGTRLPNIFSTIIINGPAAGLNIDAGKKSGIFAVFSSPSVGDLTLSDLSLSNGNNQSGNGGAINNNGRVALTNCTLASNSSFRSGGGIYNGDTLTLTNCTLAGNSSSDFRSVGGGGIYNQGTATLFNCTLAGNSSNQGGGIYNVNNGTLNLNNSIVAGNSASVGSSDIFGAVSSGDYNLVQNTSNATLSGSHNITGQDPLLGALADNRGATFTRALLAGSPAIDAGSNALIPAGTTTDQRGAGFPRIRGGVVDIGAFEVQNSAPMVKGFAKSLNEDSTLFFAATDFSNAFSDADSGDTLQSVRIETLPADGTLNFNGQAATAGQVIAVADLGKLTFAPDANFNGSTSFAFNGSDNFGFAANPATVSLTINAVNDAPSFSVGADQTVNEDAPAQSVAKFITNISAGAANESGQKLNFIVTNDNNALFATAPSIDEKGTLTYTLAANANGVAAVSVKLHDDGGVANGGVDISAAQSFTINVSASNDAPSFALGADQTVAEASGAQSVANFATNISAGPANESAQKLNFVVTNDNNALFSVQPAIDANGTLTYTLNTKAAGTAKVSVVLQDDGGTSNGGKNTSAAQSFVITVTANPILLGVSISPKAPFTNDTLTATPVILDGAGVSYAYQWFVNGVSVQSGASNTLDLSQPGQGDKGDVVSVVVSATNTRGGAGSATNNVTVRDSAPFAFSGTTSAQSGVETRIAFNPFGNPGGADVDGDALTYKRVGGPSNGVAAFESDANGNNVLRYTSRQGFVGVEVIRFVAVEDSGRTSNVATLAIDVKGVPLVAPTAQNAVGKTQAGVSVDVALVGHDPNGGAVTFKRVGGPVNGTGGLVTLADGTTVMRYVPRAGFVGVEEIRFVALNADGRPSNVATIRITVGASGAGALQMGEAPSAANS